ncbi:MAG: hypothetical protein NTZ40_06430 [Cyanobacteria bacterium]|nr:hypothetical protein [Cyanobacteriota bacterium]
MARHLGATLNWRRDPDYEQSIVLHEQRMLQYEQRRIQHEQRMKQLRCALLSARVLLDPSDSNRARLQAFLSLIAGERPPEQGGVG